MCRARLNCAYEMYILFLFLMICTRTTESTISTEGLLWCVSSSHIAKVRFKRYIYVYIYIHIYAYIYILGAVGAPPLCNTHAQKIILYSSYATQKRDMSPSLPYNTYATQKRNIDFPCAIQKSTVSSRVQFKRALYRNSKE